MSLSNKKKTQSTSDIFDDDFEVIYEGDLPDISIDDDDDYRDVLSGLSDIDHTDYIKKNDYDRLTKKLKNKNKKAGKKNKKQSKKDNFFDTAYYDDDIFDELDDDLYDDEYKDDYDNEYEDDCDDPRNNRQKEKKSRPSPPSQTDPAAHYSCQTTAPWTHHTVRPAETRIQIHQSSVKNGNTSADCLDHLSFGTAFSGQCRFVWQYCFPLNISGSGTDRISRGWCGIIAL